jgi:hypothetical protein
MRCANLSPSTKTDAVAVLDADAAPIRPHFDEMETGSGAASTTSRRWIVEAVGIEFPYLHL